MCGIFGLVLKARADITREQTAKLLVNLFKLSESRGKESAGLHFYLPVDRHAWTLKSEHSAKEFLSSAQFNSLLQNEIRNVFEGDRQRPARPMSLLGHSRLVTNGTAQLPQNNQPVRYQNTTLIHNGIIVNVDTLWDQYSDLRRQAEVDTEIMAALVNRFVPDGMVHATRHIYRAINGAASIAWVDDRYDSTILATNTGDLYYAQLDNGAATVFASEKYILANALRTSFDNTFLRPIRIEWCPPGQGFVISMADEIENFSFALKGGANGGRLIEHPARPNQTRHFEPQAHPVSSPTIFAPEVDEALVRFDPDILRNIKRCTRCILPETFPFISFDASGICNYCHGYQPRYTTMDPLEAKQAFIQSLAKYIRPGKEPDVLVAFSGGRDSSYGLHLIKNEFGLTPITFTYDWGMVTDLARRNIARICGQLGIQNILVSADIARKRENIRKNVSAWLKKPVLGLVPLFMAGDKHFFSVVNQIKRQTGIRLDLWCANPLENTDFKSGFCGVKPDFNKARLDYLSLGRKIKMALFYGLNFAQNPHYINASLLDTASAFWAYYGEPRWDHYFIFNHMIWQEDDVNNVLLSKYDWELSPDSISTWRIGDGTAPFYNYIYLTACGFTEFDTFRSNQIREGMISRDEALELVLKENRPRIPSLRWYLDTINLDFNRTIKRINQLAPQDLL